MTIQEKSLKLAYQLFKESKSRKEQNHFTFLYERNKLISVGFNTYEMRSKALKFANLFNIENKKKWPTLHSECDAISKCWGKYYLDKRIRLINVRIIRNGNLGMSAPCRDCKTLLDAIGIQDIWYTNSNGAFECLT